MTNQTIKISKLKPYSIILGEKNLPSFWTPARRNICNQFYIIKCFNETESFIKIGCSSYKLSRRFNSRKSMPYNYKVIFQATENRNVNNDIFLALCLEVYFQNLFKKYQYCPQIKFGGYLECFKEDILKDYKFIKNLQNLLTKTQ